MHSSAVPTKGYESGPGGSEDVPHGGPLRSVSQLRPFLSAVALVKIATGRVPRQNANAFSCYLFCRFGLAGSSIIGNDKAMVSTSWPLDTRFFTMLMRISSLSQS
jgi:hypothetical protein